MYLKQAVIQNSGPLRRLDVDLTFTEDGLPKPLVLVGTNGGGKTNFLSLVTDALFEAAATHYENVLPAQGLGRAWFRVVGGRTTSIGATGGFSLLRFEHSGESFIYKEKGGTLDPAQIAHNLPAELQAAAQWPVEGAVKEMSIDQEQSRKIFENGAYAYFPSSRSEIPYWLNRESLPETEFEVFGAFAKRLRKPIFVERGLHEFKQWVISVILESRAHVGASLNAEGGLELQVVGNAVEAFAGTTVLNHCNLILQKVLGAEEARFVWIGRKNADKIAVGRGNELFLPNLDSLSGGQSILLSLFGTLLRYGDQSQAGVALDISLIEGICVVDEIDSHIHVELKHRVLPALIRMFPRIQFIVSSHSPLFVIGMEKEFGPSGFNLLEMPAGNVVTAETYSEFGRAMEALSATEAFSQRVLSETSAVGKPLVFVEGETDTPYIRRAADLLDRAALIGRCDIQWIGAKDQKGQGFHTGKDALDHTLAVLRANPKLAQRPVLLLYDNDTKKADADYDAVSVRCMPTNLENTKVLSGIENLLQEIAITSDDYQIVESAKPNGDIVIRKSLRKMELCERMCEHGSANDFAAFNLAFDKIQAYLETFAPLPSNKADTVLATE